MFFDAFDSIVKATEENVKLNDGDYQVNGLWYCGKCNTPKQVRVTFLDVEMTPFCLCKCAAEEEHQREEEKKRREREKEIEVMRSECFFESNMKNWTFANDDMKNEQITKALMRYVDNFAELRKNGSGLLLYGPTGTGKTYAACEIANALIDKLYSVFVTNFSEILNTIQGTFDKQEYINELNKYSLLVIDDLGIERETSFAKEQVFNVIDARYRVGKPMIITTNLSLDKIKKSETIQERRIYERILERCFPLEISGKSRRRIEASENYLKMKDLLGL